jgi:hypothetical protein
MANETDKIVLEVELKDANIIMTALVELPWKISNDLIGKLQKQIMPQVKQSDGNVVQMNSAD